MAPSKEDYVPLHQDSLTESYTVDPPSTQWPARCWRDIALVVLVAFNIVSVGSYLWAQRKADYGESSYTGIHEYPKQWVPSEWWSLYSVEHENQTAAADAAWEAVQPAHGFVAVDPQWAEERKLLPSMELPSDTSKRVYILEAYHMLHCLKIMRKTFYEVLRGSPTSFKLGHTSHCFDALRQNIMCNADDTLLYTFGRARAGDGQARKCRDWNYLRNWATANTACYLEHEDKEGGRFFRCDEGDDGLIVKSAQRY